MGNVTIQVEFLKVSLFSEGIEERIMYCIACDGEAGVMGILGNLVWMQCRNCGIQFNHEAETEEETI